MGVDLTALIPLFIYLYPFTLASKTVTCTKLDRFNTLDFDILLCYREGERDSRDSYISCVFVPITEREREREEQWGDTVGFGML